MTGVLSKASSPTPSPPPSPTKKAHTSAAPPAPALPPPPLPRLHLQSMPELVHQRLHPLLDLQSRHRLMETNTQMMEAHAVYVKAVDLNQEPPFNVDLALNYLRRRPRLSRVKVEPDMMGVLAEAMRSGCCDAMEVLEMDGELSIDSDDDPDDEEVAPEYLAERFGDISALCDALGDGMCARLDTLLIGKIWRTAGTLHQKIRDHLVQVELLGAALQSRNGLPQPPRPIASLSLEGVVLTSLAPLLSSLSYAALKELEFISSASALGAMEDESHPDWQWLANLSAPQLQTFTASGSFLPNLFQGLSHPGVAPRLQTLHLMLGKQDPGERLAPALRRKAWPELRNLVIGGALPPVAMVVELMEAIKLGTPDLRQLVLVNMESSGDDDDRCLKIQTVLQGLKNGACPRLEILYLSCEQHLGDDEVEELARALEGGAPCNTTLLKLCLSSPRIGTRGVRALAAAFTRGACPELERLSVDEVPNLDEGVIELTRALEAGALASLRVLELRSLGGAGRAALFNGLGSSMICPKLRKIVLSAADSTSAEERRAYVDQLVARRGRDKRVAVIWR